MLPQHDLLVVLEIRVEHFRKDEGGRMEDERKDEGGRMKGGCIRDAQAIVFILPPSLPHAPIDQVQFDVVPTLVGVDHGAKGNVDRPVYARQRFGPFRGAKSHCPQAHTVLRQP
jgi:hypothetical protein